VQTSVSFGARLPDMWGKGAACLVPVWRAGEYRNENRAVRWARCGVGVVRCLSDLSNPRGACAGVVGRISELGWNSPLGAAAGPDEATHY